MNTNLYAVSSPSVRAAQAHVVSSKELNVLRHAIGYDDAGSDRWPNARSLDERRNRFFTDPAGEDGQLCQALCALGLMADHGPQAAAGGMHFYYVTENGRSVVMAHKPVPVKLTRSQERYRRYISVAEVFPSFRAFLRWDASPEARKTNF